MNLTLIMLVLIALKAYGVINVAWWVILLPFILVLGLFSIILVLIILAVILGIIAGAPVRITTDKKKQ